MIESPLHDKDVNGDGEIKKAILGILIMFESVKTYDQVLVDNSELKASRPEKM